MTVKENIENRIAKLKEDKDRVEHCEMPDWIYAAELQCAIVELQQVLRWIENQKTGHWIDKGSLSCRCSECGCKANKETRFCANCGAKMEGETKCTIA